MYLFFIYYIFRPFFYHRQVFFPTTCMGKHTEMGAFPSQSIHVRQYTVGIM